MTDAPARILIVDDDPIVAESLAEFLSAEGYAAATAASAAEALGALAKAEREAFAVGLPPRPFDLVISDISMPRADGLALLKEITKKHRGTAAVMLTGYGTIESAVESLRHGACDYLTKPVVDQELRLSLERALRQRALLRENQNLRAQIDSRYGLDNIVGADHRMLKIYDLIEAVAPSRTTVLMTGESGTGKSLIAHAIHHRSPRRDKPYVELSCGSIPETLLESELFGHVRGAFTGAVRDKAGLFEVAGNGTLFLDEIGEVAPTVQAKLLRALQEREIRRVGAERNLKVNARVVAATNRDLRAAVELGTFREDLYFRLSAFVITVPPLRDRREDIPSLVHDFLGRAATRVKKDVKTVSAEAMTALMNYSWPGNVRELEHAIERAVIVARGTSLKVRELPPEVSQNTRARPTDNSLDLHTQERAMIERALELFHGNRRQAADALKISPVTLWRKMKQYGLGT